MYNGKKVYIVIPSGRKRFLEILVEYLILEND